MFARAALALFLLTLLALPARAEKRAWTSSDGNSTFEGELMEFTASEVRIKRSADFQTFEVPLEGEDHLIAAGVDAKPELHDWIFAQRLTPAPAP